MKLLKKHETLLTFLVILIITIPSFLRILNGQYFSMHDDQHVVRLYLLDRAIKEGSLFPRWVGGLGFGFGYPLFNFYPPLVYYVAEFFHLIGFSLFLSVKLTFILGFLLAAIGIFLFVKNLIGRMAGIVALVLYTYFSYHAVNAYVRGALAEFFGMAILPFVFLSLDNLFKKKNSQAILIFAIVFALMMLVHPLVSFPALFYLVFFGIFYLVISKNQKERLSFIVSGIKSVLLGLGLSAFFWLPSLMERKFTLVNDILTKELANYKLHYIYPSQFWYSLWGFGGSVKGPYDGMSFQLGKIHIFLFFLALLLCLLTIFLSKPLKDRQYFFLFIFLSIFSLFMTTSYSSMVWDNIHYLWYLQFPWRFLLFAGFFIAVSASYLVYFCRCLINRNSKIFITVFVAITCLLTIGIYGKYFKPQKQFNASDNFLTSEEEVEWRISKSSFEFVPKGVATKKTELNTTTLAIEKKDLPKNPFILLNGKGAVEILKDNFVKKEFAIDLQSSATFRLNIYYFPGWKAYLDGKELTIQDNNKLKLITVNLPAGKAMLVFKFQNTPTRTIANLLSFISLLMIIFLTFKSKIPTLIQEDK